MSWKVVLVVLLSTLVAVGAYYIGYCLVFFYLYLCEARKPGSGNRMVRRIFSPIVAHILETRGEFDPDVLKRLDFKMVKGIPLLIFLMITVLGLLGYLTLVAFRYLVGT